MPTIDPYVLLLAFVRKVAENYPHLLSAKDTKELTDAFAMVDMRGDPAVDVLYPALEQKNILRVADHISMALDGKPWRRAKIKLGEVLFTKEEVDQLFTKASRYLDTSSDEDEAIEIVDSETGEVAELLSVEPDPRPAGAKPSDADILKELLDGMEFDDGTASKVTSTARLTPAGQRFKVGGPEQPQKVRHHDTALTNERWGTW